MPVRCPAAAGWAEAPKTDPWIGSHPCHSLAEGTVLMVAPSGAFPRVAVLDGCCSVHLQRNGRTSPSTGVAIKLQV